MEEHKLGSEAIDVATGLSGILVSRTELLGGTVQYALQLPASGIDLARYPDAMNIDSPQVKVVGDGISHQMVKPAAFKFELGNEVEDLISGAKGMIISRTTFTNGCLYYTVECKGEGKPDERIRFLVEQRLKKVGDGVAIKKLDRGGPTVRAMRAS